VFRAGPGTTAAPTGDIYAVLRAVRGHLYNDPKEEEFETLHVGFDVERRDRPGRLAEWIESIGDYSTHVSGVRVRGRWVQFFGAALPEDAWLAMSPDPQDPWRSASSDPLRVLHILPLAGEILWLRPLRARWPDGSHRSIARGAYLIQRVTNGTITFREEVETDFDCDQGAKPPRVMPPTLRATPSEFFDSDGSARFEVKYTKGC
jgi:hypothetical protein